MPVKEAIRAGHVANFQIFLYNGWDINEQVDLDGPPALGYVPSVLASAFHQLMVIVTPPNIDT